MTKLEEVAARINASGLACKVWEPHDGKPEIIGAEALKFARIHYFEGILYQVSEEGDHLFAKIQIGQTAHIEIRAHDPVCLVAGLTAIVANNSYSKH